MDELQHECGIAAVYHLPGYPASPLGSLAGPEQVSRLMPRMLLDLQNRGQLAAGFTTFNPQREKLLDTYKQIGTVIEAFRLNHQAKYDSIMRGVRGPGRHRPRPLRHLRRQRPQLRPAVRAASRLQMEMVRFAFNGQLANFTELRDQLLTQTDYHLTRNIDTEVIMHYLSHELSQCGDERPDLVEVFRNLSQKFDGAYNLVFLNAMGDMVVLRDPERLPAAVLRPGRPAVRRRQRERAAAQPRLPRRPIAGAGRDDRHPGQRDPPSSASLTSADAVALLLRVDLLRQRGQHAGRPQRLPDAARPWARSWPARNGSWTRCRWTTTPSSCRCPDTGKAAADAMAFELGVPSVEGLIRNRYIGRTFIEGQNRAERVQLKYTPLREVLEGKRVLLIEDTIVRSTTMKTLLHDLRERGGAREIHVRVACPPIMAPCFYGIDMSTVRELFAPRFMKGSRITEAEQDAMAAELGCRQPVLSAAGGRGPLHRPGRAATCAAPA